MPAIVEDFAGFAVHDAAVADDRHAGGEADALVPGRPPKIGTRGEALDDGVGDAGFGGEQGPGETMIPFGRGAALMVSTASGVILSLRTTRRSTEASKPPMRRTG